MGQVVTWLPTKDREIMIRRLCALIRYRTVLQTKIYLALAFRVSLLYECVPAICSFLVDAAAAVFVDPRCDLSLVRPRPA